MDVLNIGHTCKYRGRIKYYSTQVLELVYKTSEDIIGIVLQNMLVLSYLL